jgi:hypothetical protein
MWVWRSEAFQRPVARQEGDDTATRCWVSREAGGKERREARADPEAQGKGRRQREGRRCEDTRKPTPDNGKLVWVVRVGERRRASK